MFLMTEPVRSLAATGQSELSFREVVDTHKRAVYYLALDLTGNHHDAEDLSQEVFIKAHKALHRFRGDSGLYTWLRRIAINTYLNKKRKKALSMMRFFGDDETAGETVAQTPSPSQLAEGAVLRSHIDRALENLSPRERTAFVLRHHHDLSIRDVAEDMEVADGTVKSLLHRATRKLKTELAHLHADAGGR